LEHDWEHQREQLSALLDNELGTQERAELEAHLATCADCRAELASLQRARSLLRALPQPSLPRSFTLPLGSATIQELPRQAVSAGHPARQTGGAQPARNTHRRRPAQVLQWISTIAAVLGIIVLLSGVFTTRTFSNEATSASSMNTNQRPSASAGQPTSTTNSEPDRTPSTTHPTVPTTAPTNGSITSTPEPPFSQGASPSPDLGSSLGTLITSTGLGVLLLLLSVCGFAIAWAMRRRL
jgi:negative regulator of sigma E activity